MINLSRVIHSPMLSQEFSIERRHGKWKYGSCDWSEPETIVMRGIVTIAGPRDAQAVPEGDRRQGTIKVLTLERLYITEDSAGVMSDVVVWGGEKYKVSSVSLDGPYGFYRAVCTRLGGNAK